MPTRRASKKIFNLLRMHYWRIAVRTLLRFIAFLLAFDRCACKGEFVTDVRCLQDDPKFTEDVKQIAMGLLSS